MIIVSACLCGINCKYSGGNNLNSEILELFKEGKAIPVCPEQLGGLETPRDPSEIINGEGKDVLDKKTIVISNKGKDVTEGFVKGAYETLNICKELKVTRAILKKNSPSCGFGAIYDGNFKGKLIEGNGVTAELLKRNGIKVEVI